MALGWVLALEIPIILGEKIRQFWSLAISGGQFFLFLCHMIDSYLFKEIK